jgi:uncharacterized RDD family membrane protein YckC
LAAARLPAGASVLRAAARVRSAGGDALFNVPTLLDGLWPLWDERNQALHDKVANTFVIYS